MGSGVLHLLREQEGEREAEGAAGSVEWNAAPGRSGPVSRMDYHTSKRLAYIFCNGMAN